MTQPQDEMTQPQDERKRRITERTRQLILMRETGPKRAAWHVARMRMIWRLHDDLRRIEEPPPSADGAETADRGS
jgi:hypothetical protein